MVTIKSKRCVNSTWIAAFLANETQEHCQCGMCKIRVLYNNYEYIVTEKELKELENESHQVDAVVIQLPKEVKMIQVLVDRLNDYERQLRSDCYINRQKISHKVKELKKCIRLMQSV